MDNQETVLKALAIIKERWTTLDINGDGWDEAMDFSNEIHRGVSTWDLGKFKTLAEKLF